MSPTSQRRLFKLLLNIFTCILFYYIKYYWLLALSALVLVWRFIVLLVRKRAVCVCVCVCDFTEKVCGWECEKTIPLYEILCVFVLIKGYALNSEYPFHVFIIVFATHTHTHTHTHHIA